MDTKNRRAYPAVYILIGSELLGHLATEDHRQCAQADEAHGRRFRNGRGYGFRKRRGDNQIADCICRVASLIWGCLAEVEAVEARSRAADIGQVGAGFIGSVGVNPETMGQG